LRCATGRPDGRTMGWIAYGGPALLRRFRPVAWCSAVADRAVATSQRDTRGSSPPSTGGPPRPTIWPSGAQPLAPGKNAVKGKMQENKKKVHFWRFPAGFRAASGGAILASTMLARCGRGIMVCRGARSGPPSGRPQAAPRPPSGSPPGRPRDRPQAALGIAPRPKRDRCCRPPAAASGRPWDRPRAAGRIAPGIAPGPPTWPPCGCTIRRKPRFSAAFRPLVAPSCGTGASGRTPRGPPAGSPTGGVRRGDPIDALLRHGQQTSRPL
jgi:hypothetical protein